MAGEIENYAFTEEASKRLNFFMTLVLAWDDQERKEKLAQLLKDFLNQHDEGDEKFSRGANYEAELLSAAFGSKILRTIGDIYREYNLKKREKNTAMEPEGRRPSESREKTTDQNCGKEIVNEDPGKKTRANPQKDTLPNTLSKLDAGYLEKTYTDVVNMVFSSADVEDKSDIYLKALEALGEIFCSSSDRKSSKIADKGSSDSKSSKIAFKGSSDSKSSKIADKGSSNSTMLQKKAVSVKGALEKSRQYVEALVQTAREEVHNPDRE